MSIQLAVIDAPVRAIRPEELGITGLQGHRVPKLVDLRTELRNALFRQGAKHRSTFIPLERYSLGGD
jgi:hypothetical protein